MACDVNFPLPASADNIFARSQNLASHTSMGTMFDKTFSNISHRQSMCVAL